MYMQMQRKYILKDIEAIEKINKQNKNRKMKSFCLTNVTTLSGSASSVRFPVITTASSKEYAKVSTNSFRSCNRVCSWNFRTISSLEWTGKYSIRTNFLDGMILISADTRKPSVP